MVDIEGLIGDEQDAYAQFEAGRLQLRNNVFYNIGTSTEGSEIFTTNN
jgi:hypothetical protein